MPWLTRMLCLALLLWSLGHPFPALAQDSAAPPGGWRLTRVQLIGFAGLGDQLAQESMENQEQGLILRSERPLLDEASLERDRLRLAQLFAEHGFFEAQVSYQIEYHPPRGAASVAFTAREGPPTLVTALELELAPGVDRELWQERLLAQARLPLGRRFTLAGYQETKAALARFLADQGHPLHQVYGQVRVHEEERQATVVLQVDPGPELLFGPVRVSGESRVSREYILRQITFVRGQPFSRSELEASQRALLDTGFFLSVSLDPDYESVEAGQVPIVAEVRDAKRYSVRLGLGWGNEDGFRLRILQVNRNLLGLNDTLAFEGKISSIYQGLIGRLRLPDQPGRLTDLVISGGLEQKENEAFVNRRTFVSPIVEYRLPGHWWWYLGYNLERDRMIELKAQVPNPAFEKQQLHISSLPLGLKYDTRDSPLDAKRGSYLHLEMETASDALGSEVEFVRPQLEIRQVLPLPWPQGWHVAARAKAGLVYGLPGTDRIPLVRRFFPGGADSVRGYPYQKLGPLDGSGKPLGGEAMAEASVELRLPLWGELGAVTFLDMGNAWEKFNSEVGSLRFTGGAGLRYNTPVGPLRLDVGYQLNPPDNSPLSRYQVYLSVGQAF